MKIYMYIVWNCCLPIADFETTGVQFHENAHFFIKNHLFFIIKLNFAYLSKTQTSNMSFYKKNSIFGKNRDP